MRVCGWAVCEGVCVGCLLRCVCGTLGPCSGGTVKAMNGVTFVFTSLNSYHHAYTTHTLTHTHTHRPVAPHSTSRWWQRLLWQSGALPQWHLGLHL